LALTRQAPKAHKLAPFWPAIRDMLALGYSLRYAVRKRTVLSTRPLPILISAIPRRGREPGF
jgi:hypothetical protein